MDLLNINLSWPNWNTNINQNLENLQNNLQNSTQEFGNFIQNKTTETIDQSKGFFGNTWHISETIANDLFSNILSSINSTFNNLLLNHPYLAKMLQIITWGINHPLGGILILLLVIAVIFSIIKAIMKLIETASWSILKAPFILLKNSILGTFKVWKKSRQGEQSKQQRLLEIHQRLGELHTEQQQLLTEASQLISALEGKK